MQAEQREKAKELIEAQTRLFAVLTDSRAVEEVSLSERKDLNAKLASVFDHAKILQDLSADFKE